MSAMPFSESQAERDREVGRVLLGVLFLNLVVAVAKLVVGWMSGAISMVADGFHSMTDTASNVVGLVGISVARRPPDEDHPYGHRRFETLAALAIGALLALTAWEVLQSCIERLLEGGVPEVTRLAFAVMGGTMAVNIAVALFERRRARELDSELLRADAAHTSSDILTSLTVIVSLVAVEIGYPLLDVAAALLITGFIAVTAFKILRDNGMLLTDRVLMPAERVREAALTVPEVVSVHKIRTRAGVRGGHADLHVQVRPDLRLDEAHLIGHKVAETLREQLGLRDVLVHVEPPIGHRTVWPPEGTD